MHFDDCAFCISVMTGLIIEMLFMLFSVYNTVTGLKMSVLANGFSTNNLLGACQEIIMVIFLKNKQTSLRKCQNELGIKCPLEYLQV